MNGVVSDRAPIQSVSIVIPLYNEEEAILQLRDRMIPIMNEMCRRWQVQLLLIDDGSTDRTYPLLEEHFHHVAGVQILQHEVNQGIGAAMRTGFAAARGEVVCTMDSDCTYAPEAMIDMVEALYREQADIITASPYHPAVALEGGRRIWLSKICSLLYTLLVPVNLYCYTSFFRAYRRRWARTELSVSGGFLAVTEILLAAAFCGAHIVEYPLKLTTRTKGRSKMRTFQTMVNHLGLMGRTVLLNLRLLLGLGVWDKKANRAELVEPVDQYSLCESFEAMLGRWVPVKPICRLQQAVAPALTGGFRPAGLSQRPGPLATS